MTSYYFPFGNASAVSIQNISHSLFATTASTAQFATISVTTALYATSVQLTPSAGTSGSSMNIDSCSLQANSGSQGPSGSRGAPGADRTSCPAGTVECPGLLASASILNNSRASGSQFSIVCMDLDGCPSGSFLCPSVLPLSSPSASLPTIP